MGNEHPYPRPAACEPRGCTVTPTWTNPEVGWTLTHSGDGIGGELTMTDYAHVIVDGPAREQFDAWGASLHPAKRAR